MHHSTRLHYQCVKSNLLFSLAPLYDTRVGDDLNSKRLKNADDFQPHSANCSHEEYSGRMSFWCSTASVQQAKGKLGDTVSIFPHQKSPRLIMILVFSSKNKHRSPSHSCKLTLLLIYSPLCNHIMQMYNEAVMNVDHSFYGHLQRSG